MRWRVKGDGERKKVEVKRGDSEAESQKGNGGRIVREKKEDSEVRRREGESGRQTRASKIEMRVKKREKGEEVRER